MDVSTSAVESLGSSSTPPIFLFGAFLILLPWFLAIFTPKNLRAILQKNSLWLQRLAVTLQDYRCGRYYLPFGLGERELVKITDPARFQELSEASELSQRAVYADMFAFKTTLRNLNPDEQKLARTRLFNRVLQMIGPAQVKKLHPLLKDKLESEISRFYQNGHRVKDGTIIRLADMLETTSSKLFAIYFFGEALSNEKEFMDAAQQHPRDLVSTLVVSKLAPRPLRASLASIITRRGKALNSVMTRLLPILEGKDASWSELDSVRRLTLLQTMIESTRDSDYWTPEMIGQALMGIWLAASFQPWVNLHFVILTLCQKPEYIDLLRTEIEQSEEQEMNFEKLPLLDSFLREVFRTHPLDHLGVRRKALVPYQFSKNGPFVPQGKVACIPSQTFMQDPKYYTNPDSFDGGRFLGSGTKFIDVTESFLAWGYGSLSCPGRFHASFVLKMAVCHLIRCYDFELVDKMAQTSWSWESFVMPTRGTKILLRRRLEGGKLG